MKTLPAYAHRMGVFVKYSRILDKRGAHQNFEMNTGKVSKMNESWHVVHVKPRAEKKLRSFLNVLHIWNYLPSRVRVCKVQRRIKRIEKPIFPGYLLVRLREGERTSVLKTNLVISLIDVDRPRPLIHQLRDIMKAVRSEREVRTVSPSDLSVGDCVRITQGPLKGIVGFVSDNTRKHELVISVEAFGGAVSVKLAPGDCLLQEDR